MPIEVREVKTKTEKKKFIQFQLDLYKGNPYFVPPLIADELSSLDKDKNPVFDHAEARLFLAYKGNKIVGRIAGLINYNEVNDTGKPKMRFGWFDFVDDLEVSKALLAKIEEIGKEKDLEILEGPLGFGNLDKAGFVTEGYDELATEVTIYNHPYYIEHLRKHGFNEATAWIEFEILAPKKMPEKVLKFIDIIKRRYKLEVMQFGHKREFMGLADDMFDLLEKTYSSLPSFVPFSKRQRKHYVEKYFKFISPDFVTCIANEKNELVAFAITMPSYAKALQKAQGKLFPFGWFHLWQATKKNDRAAFYLIGVDPKLQGKGVTALIFMEMFKTFNKHNIVYLETNPELEDNKNVQLLWGDYEHRQHKKRQTFQKAIKV